MALMPTVQQANPLAVEAYFVMKDAKRPAALGGKISPLRDDHPHALYHVRESGSKEPLNYRRGSRSVERYFVAFIFYICMTMRRLSKRGIVCYFLALHFITIMNM